MGEEVRKEWGWQSGVGRGGQVRARNDNSNQGGGISGTNWRPGPGDYRESMEVTVAEIPINRRYRD